ncbi:sulfite exporter TauE/SafE family protein [Pseudorhodoferax sp.]|uniref:sulfite exporter TauE/SafE family protein n=1 Tax=Pseudorhodoferax sp. TaxID=1993553 RepID=UPI002DD683B6|nr:sulfite exporter TauE/SafE family protein [Pseudorhodoferax sp.]
MSRIPDPQPATAAQPQAQPRRHWLLWTLPPLALLAAAWGLAQATLPAGWLGQALHAIGEGVQTRGFWTAAAVGLGAQIVDGALGMAYGVTSTTFLLSTGVPPAAASASVHIAEIFTTGFSGFSHFKLGNVNKALFKRLLIPGVVGGLIGAYIVTSIDANTIKPFISAYLLLIGLYILSKVWRQLRVQTEPPKYVAPLALTGGFVDAVGGGGWGPVVTTSLIGGGHDPRTTIGSVNAAKFFIALATGLSFTMLGGLTHWTTIAGLVFGGLFAAPFAAVLTRYAPTKLLLAIVGLLISALSAYNLFKLF